ncbi:hypothetical protein G8770_16760 [Aestuariicella hydrocarbonica]|uniref:PEP-CTERM protein-sorting domain-containing protein n=1 Tax=Pseudomaricurvus hydrocarbonicus TaxID=1470433 RepID=A0A9E5T1W5_9GAMM|nr:hypothetical protein [Aestuariicella hydrocarbonica]NHO67201.1 hypothetical protein [Aestuariicella hydrocarbonica]
MNKIHWILALVVFMGVSTGVHAGFFSYGGGYNDGTSFKVLYEDKAGNTDDGFCSGTDCRIFDIIFDFGPGSVLGNYAANPANPFPGSYPNIFAVNLDDPLLNNIFSFSLSGLDGPFGGSFSLLLENPDPLFGTDSVRLSDGPLFINDVYCRGLVPGGPNEGNCTHTSSGPLFAGINLGHTNGALAEFMAIENPFPDSVNEVPSPATWLLLVTGLLAIAVLQYRPRRRAGLATARA